MSKEDLFVRLFTEDGETELKSCPVCGRPFRVGDPVFINEVFGDVLCDACYEEEEGYDLHKVIGEREMINYAF